MPDYDVSEIWASVERVAQGSASASDADREAFAWLQRKLKLSRSPEQYAPRTRRRYRQASEQGITAREKNSQEYQIRVLRKLMHQRNSMLTVNEVELDMHDIAENVLAFGYKNVKRAMVEQIDSIGHWIDGEAGPGNRRWYGRRPTKTTGTISRYRPGPWADMLDDELLGGVQFFGNELYFYHGTTSRL